MPHLFLHRGVKKLTLLATLMGMWGTGWGTREALAQFPTELDQYIEKARRDWEVPGLAIVVVRNDSVLAAKGYGVRELGKPDRVDANTVFNIASLTKSFTAAAAATVVDQGKVSWDTPVHQLLPEYVLSDPWLTQNVTLRDLLSHRVGFHASNQIFQLTNVTRADIIRRARYFWLERPFRTEEVYSNVGVTIAAEAFSRAAGMSYEDLVRQRLLAPLGMRSTSITTAEFVRATNRVTPHAQIGGVQRPIRVSDIDVIAPAGGINSTASDMATWLRFQMGDGTFNGKRIFSADQMWTMHFPQVVAFPVTQAMKSARQVRFWPGYALGWNVMDYQGHQMLWHSGNGDGQPSIMEIFPDDHLGIVVMMNSWIAGLLHTRLINKIADVYLNLPSRDWSGELLPRKAEIAAADAMRIHELSENRGVERPASHELSAYVGSYLDSLYGNQTVRLENGKLTMQMNGGEIADLTHWTYDTFLTVWRDPLYREEFPSLVTFSTGPQGRVNRLSMRLNRDQIESRRVEN
ncbi:MAG TPA: serine hydrolase [Gemmatimonadaceae bacterium]|jgi:CubicO group peptidase (beta-lactamase class C family)|nr:serine hydrolase [Gemmatimonadaceae bacterium]